MPRYTTAVGQKFHPDGRARTFPGNTVICHVPGDTPQFDLLRQLRDWAAAQPWGSKFHFLPPSSYHMTVFDAVCDQVRQPENWPRHLPLAAPLEAVDQLLLENFPQVAAPAQIEVQYRLFYAARGFIGMFVQPTSPAIERDLRAYRNRLAESFGIRHPNHETYNFHISLAYQIEQFTPLEKFQAVVFNGRMHRRLRTGFGVLKLNAPELTFFENMTYFGVSRQDAIAQGVVS